MEEIQKKPKVSVCVVTYNHEKYIEQCLQSIVDQEVDFEFEVIVGEDCSTDDTRGILRQFAERYPSVIKPIYNETNLGACKNYIAIQVAATGTYVAHCDGDDFWYPGKLAYQVEFLDNHPEIAAIFSNANYGNGVRNKSSECGVYRLEAILEKVYTKNLCIHSSILERNAAANLLHEDENGLFDFVIYWLKHGSSLIYIDPAIRVNYSKNPEGLCGNKNFIESLRLSLHRMEKSGINEKLRERMHFDYELLKYFSNPLVMNRPSIATAIRQHYGAEILGRLIVPKKMYRTVKSLGKSVLGT
ncbi:glycosyltransferase [Noviherbaspirillum cavernae]|uniref:Glycosyltransferase n=1 Tax=Noviherbaspirillum cavernae TaxID=2320862 RepID=A0A418X060_9BURK|nr:glycosyltransferase family 2 protein [Noviherbaspirillum cavernae]RJG05831.1 glycosyltransferase [Noviherbaspirillum cavernae]